MTLPRARVWGWRAGISALVLYLVMDSVGAGPSRWIITYGLVAMGAAFGAHLIFELLPEALGDNEPDLADSDGGDSA